MALTTLTQVKTKLGISGTSEDAVLTALVAQADRAIKTWTRRSLESTSSVEYPRGYGTKTLRLREQPVTSVTEVRIDVTRVFTSSLTLLTADVDYKLINGMLYRLNGVWPAARENRIGLLADALIPSDGVIKVSYIGGYATLPDDLVLAADMLVAHLYKMRQDGEAMISESLEDFSYTRGSGDGDPDPLRHIKRLVAPYRRLTI